MFRVVATQFVSVRYPDRLPVQNVAFAAPALHLLCRFASQHLFVLIVFALFSIASSAHAAGVETDSAELKSVAIESADTASIDQRWVSAISNDNTDLLQQLVEREHDPAELVRLAASNGKSALMVACKRGELAFAKRLVELGANVHSVTRTGGTALMFAALGNHVDVASWLQQYGIGVDARGSNGWSAATIAGAKGLAEFLQWLIDAGADVDHPDVYRFTPLIRAVDNRHLSAARLLLSTGKVSIDSQEESGNTALHFAVANQHTDMVLLLMKHGANAAQQNRDGDTPLYLATDEPALMALLTKSRK